MSSEHRLHPYSILFAFITQIRLFVIPGILVAVGASSRNGDWWDWQPWMMLLIIPNAIVAAVRYFTYAYRFDESELVIRSGLIFRRERHIPYSRIQNIDAVQNVLHRLLGVAEVKLETGGGDTAEATMSVLPLGALDDMRTRVFAKRVETAPDATVVAVPPPLLALSTRELDAGRLHRQPRRGDHRRGIGPAVRVRRVRRSRGLRCLANRQRPTGHPHARARHLVDRNRVAGAVLIALVVVVALLLFVRLASMFWAVVRLHGFTLRLMNDDLRREFGLLTRVTLTRFLGVASRC